MADTENSHGTATTTGENGMPPADATFLITCLKNANGGAISVSFQFSDANSSLTS
jgi:hypothetical protein